MKNTKKPFVSLLSPQLEEFVLFRKSSKRCNMTDETVLRNFDKYCAADFSDHKSIYENMLKWCKERPTEHGNSRYRRMLIVVEFVEYANAKGYTQVKPPLLPCNRKSTHVPHAFEEEELTRFFTECDRYSLGLEIHKGPKTSNRFNRIELPVFFRLLFSTGMRTVELRELRRIDVDLERGIINICKSKGYDQHRVALHHTTCTLLKLYDAKMDSIMPSRTIFFPDPKGKHHAPRWHDWHFRKIWMLSIFQVSVFMICVVTMP
jgi:integrase